MLIASSLGGVALSTTDGNGISIFLDEPSSRAEARAYSTAMLIQLTDGNGITLYSAVRSFS